MDDNLCAGLRWQNGEHALKLMSMETNREKSPLMKALHELGLKHGLTFVVVARPIDGAAHDQQSLLIDHKDDTPIGDIYTRYLQAGIYLIQATGAIEDYVAQKRAQGSAPAESP